MKQSANGQIGDYKQGIQIQSTIRYKPREIQEKNEKTKRMTTSMDIMKTKIHLNKILKEDSHEQNQVQTKQKSTKKLGQLEAKNKSFVKENNSNIPPIAQLCTEIILKIAEYPKKQQLERASLVDQICQIIEEFSKNLEKKNKQYFEQIKPKIKKLQRLFKEGIESGHALEQQRINDTANKTGRHNFHPTYTVTGQIMRRLILGQISNYSTLFGHHGIAKTFAYYLYHQLSNMFISQMINCGKSVVQAFFLQKSAKLQFRGPLDQKLFLNIPKLIYWTMAIKSEIDEEYLIQLFLRQCPQIHNQIALVNEDIKKICIYSFVRQICSLYRKKGIIVYLVIDQINKIASCFRNYFIIVEKTQKNPQKRKNQQYQGIQKKYQSASKLNNFRKSLLSINEGFHCIFYSSSVNMETFFEMDGSSSRNVYQQIIDKLQLYNQQKHAQRYSKPLRIFYPEIIKLESSIWSLTDIIIFELKKLDKLSVPKQQVGTLRKKIFEYLKENQPSVAITFFRIAKTIQEKYLQSQIKVTVQNVEAELSVILKQVEKKQKDWLKQNLAKFKEKVIDPEERLWAISQIYNYLDEKNFEQKQKNIINQNSETKMKELNFLNHPITLGRSTDTFLKNHLNRHLFLFFENIGQFNRYFYQLKKVLIEHLSGWYGIQYRSEQVEKQLQQLQNKIKDKSETHNQLGFTILQPEIVIQLIEPEIKQFQKIKSRNSSLVMLQRFLQNIF